MANNTFDKAIDFVFLGLLSLHMLPGRFVRIRHYGILSPIRRDEAYVVFIINVEKYVLQKKIFSSNPLIVRILHLSSFLYM